MITEFFILFNESLRDLHQWLTVVMTPTIDLLRMPFAILIKLMKDGILGEGEWVRPLPSISTRRRITYKYGVTRICIVILYISRLPME